MRNINVARTQARERVIPTAIAGPGGRLRQIPVARSIALRIISLIRRRNDRGDGVVFLFYHDMHWRQRRAFETQLERLRGMGDFVSLDGALDVLSGGGGGRHICLTFDDGCRGAFQYAFPVLAGRGIPAAFFIVSDWVDAGRPDTVDWDACRTMAASGMTLGSHSATHRRLAELSREEAAREFSASRERIEAESGRPCQHFACPWGQPGRDYRPERDPGLAGEAGYVSFLTTIARRAQAGVSAWQLPRIRMEPGWGEDELRYAFSRPSTDAVPS
jgi:peptidoglycan/xylan/chitin deacetylase (PgdA/CDA1 family)